MEGTPANKYQDRNNMIGSGNVPNDCSSEQERSQTINKEQPKVVTKTKTKTIVTKTIEKPVWKSCFDWCSNLVGFGAKAGIITLAGVLLTSFIGVICLGVNVGSFIGKFGYVTSFRWLTNNPYR